MKSGGGGKWRQVGINKLKNILEKSEVVLPKNDSQQEQTDNGVDIESKTLGNHITGKHCILKVSIICKMF